MENIFKQYERNIKLLNIDSNKLLFEEKWFVENDYITNDIITLKIISSKDYNVTVDSSNIKDIKEGDYFKIKR